MKRQLLLIVGILCGISMQAEANNAKKAPFPTSAIATRVAISKMAQAAPTAIPLVASNQAPGVTVWPNPSQGGHSILFKAPSDPGSAIQLTLQNSLGQEVFTTSFSSRSGRSGGYVWRLQDLSGSPVPGGVYSYVLRFMKDGQSVTSTGKVTVLH